MKKIMAFTVLIAVLLTACLTGCSSGQQESSAPPVTTGPEKTTTPAATEKTTQVPTTKAPTTKEAETTAAPSTPAPSTEVPEVKDVKPLVIASSNCTTLNPYLANAAEDDFQTFTGARLYRFFPDGNGGREVIPELADGEPVQVDSEGTVWQIKIKSGLTFMDYLGQDTGKPINAETFEYSFRMALDPRLKNRAGDGYSVYITIVNAELYFKQTAESKVDWKDVGIKAIDPLTLEIRTAVPATKINVMKTFTGYSTVPVEPELFASLMAEDGLTCAYGTDVTKTYFSGGFYCTEWVKESAIVLKKNPNYVYADKVKMTDVKLLYVSNASTKLDMFLAGELDITSLNPAQGKEYAESPMYVTYPSRYLVYIEICDSSAYYERNAEGELIRHEVDPSQLEMPILGNINFKKALWYGVNRKTLANLNQGFPVTYIIPDTSEAYEDGTLFKDTDVAKSYRQSVEESYNPELAKQYFEKAMDECGYSKTDKLVIEFKTNEDFHQTQTAIVLQEQYTNVFGEDRIEIKHTVTTEVFKKLWRENPNIYQLGVSYWSRAVTDESPYNTFDTFASSFYTTAAASYHVEKVEDLVYLQKKEARVKNDREYNVKLAGEMEKAFLDECGVIPLYERNTQYLINEDLILPVNPEEVRALYYWLSEWAED